MLCLMSMQLKETGHGSHIIMSKYPEILHCNWLRDCLTEVKYNQISQLGILDGDRVRLMTNKKNNRK